MWFVDLHRLMHRVRREDRRLAAASKHQYAMARRMPRRCLDRQLVRQLKGRIDQLCQPRVQDRPDAVLEYVVVDREFPSLSAARIPEFRSEEHTSELQSLMRISYAVFCLKKKKQTNNKS